MEQRKILPNGKIERSPNGFYKTEVFINMKVSKSACSSSNPCSGYGSDVSGCLGSSNLKSIGIGNNVLAKEVDQEWLDVGCMCNLSPGVITNIVSFRNEGIVTITNKGKFVLWK